MLFYRENIASVKKRWFPMDSVLHSLLSALSSLSTHELIVQSGVQHTGVFIVECMGIHNIGTYVYVLIMIHILHEP